MLIQKYNPNWIKDFNDIKKVINEALINLNVQIEHVGKGFSKSNLVYMRQFYMKYPISEKPSHQLSWSHYVDINKKIESQNDSIFLFRNT
jgi:DUF1016 N-terminal domain